MQWNIVPEFVSLIFISILLLYSREYNLIPTLKNRLFRLCLRFIFFEIILSIVSIISIENFRNIPGWLNQAIQMMFFLASPMMAILFLFYLVAVVRENDPGISSYFWILAIPYAPYAMAVFSNPFTGLLYSIGEEDGFADGEGFLKAISRYLVEVVPIKSIYRFSGDEFIIILSEEIHISAVDAVEAIWKKFNDHWDCGGLQCMLTASIAVVRFPDHADTAGSIITLLEYCIDVSKGTGKGKAIFADTETVSRLKRKSQIIGLMRRGLLQDKFEVYFQPIYSVRENRFTTAEALLRLSDSELGVISPAEFVPIAEETGLIVEIGLMVLNKVCGFIRTLDDNEVEIDAISVNLSAIQLNSEGLVDNLLEIISTNRIHPWKLRMEITESVFVDKFDYMDNMMRKLSEYGIRFYLDDFGTGYSNIANVVDLPFEFIKIDKSILYESVFSTKCFSVMNGLARTFADVGMKVVVEGVETQEHNRMAEQINADYMQGFLFARPMPAAEAMLYLGKALQKTGATSHLSDSGKGAYNVTTGNSAARNGEI